MCAMGAFSIWHWLILLCVLALAAGVVGLVVWLAMRASRASGKPAALVQARLQQLEALKVQGLITDDEYARQRAAIVSGL